MTTARAAVVEALATVPGLTPSESMPNTPGRGSAWPVWAESRYREGKLSRPLTHTYEVRVVLPSGYHPETVDAADGLLEVLMGALAKVGTVDAAQPVSIVFEPNQTALPGVTVRLTVAIC